jgi:hypothetical protein
VDNKVIWFWFSSGAKMCFFYRVQTGPGLSNLFPNMYEGYFPGVKRQRLEADHSPLSTVEIKNTQI